MESLNIVICVFRSDAFGKDISVQIYFLQIGKDCLPVFHNCQGAAYFRDVVVTVFNVSEDQISEIDKCIVIDSPFQIFACKRGILILLLHFFSLCFQICDLFLSAFQIQLLYIVIGIADLMMNTQCDQNIRFQIGIHMGVQIGMELVLIQDIRLDDCFLNSQMIVLGL